MKYNRTLEVGQTERVPAFKDFKIYLTKGRFFVGWGRQNGNDMQLLFSGSNSFILTTENNCKII